MDIKTPETIKKAIDTPDFITAIKNIGAEFNLNIDQLGELYAETRDVIKGVNKSSDFIAHIITRLEIDTSTANKIAGELNKNIFQSIRSALQAKSISPIEQAGDFTVEPQPVEPPMHVETPTEVIEGIENPVPAQTRTETTLVDHLLSGPMVSVEKKTEQKAPVSPQPESLKAPQPQPKKPSGPDMYREPIE